MAARGDAFGHAAGGGGTHGGEEDWEVSHLRERLRQLQTPLPWLSLLDHPQMASHLQAVDVSARPMYLAQTMPPRPELFPSSTWEYDPARFRLARLQLHPSVRLGGFGIRAAASLSLMSYACGIAPSVRPGLPIQQLHVAGCCVCDTVYADLVDLRHALRCKHQHGPSRVHDEVKFAVAKISKASAEVVTMEDDMLLPGKRVDVAIRRPMDREAHALEISVADPLSLSSSLVEQCGRSMGVAAKEWERRKANDYVPFLESNRGVQFTPLIVETWGCLGGCFRRWLSQ
ncbi:unnamed protein product [Closterium sp. NIES-53]